MRICPLFVVLCALVTPATALAQPTAVDVQPTAARTESMGTGSSSRSYAADWMVNPLPELEVGVSLKFITAPENPLSPDDEEIRFTDIGIFNAGARYSFAKRFEAYGGFDLLAKQPSYLDEPILTAASGGLRMALGETWALWAQGGGGPLMNDVGAWGSASAGIQKRKSIDETVRFQGSLGSSNTRLFMGDASGRPWFSEVAAHGEAVLRSPRGEFAGWLGADYRVPIYHDDGNLDIDPQVRLNFQVGMMLGYIDNWDLFTAFTFVDRGDIQDPATTLPMIDGGFDQAQIVFGAARHFDMADKEDIEEVQKWIAR